MYNFLQTMLSLVALLTALEASVLIARMDYPAGVMIKLSIAPVTQSLERPASVRLNWNSTTIVMTIAASS